MPSRTLTPLVVVVLMIVSLAAPLLSAQGRDDAEVEFFWTRYWEVAPDSWTHRGPDRFPETDVLKHRPDFGVAFSGGGTRSAAATVGQLRGLVDNGWLSKARYLSAVSGGSWVVVPFSYSRSPIKTLLEEVRPPGDLDVKTVTADSPEGSLAHTVTHANFIAAAVREIPEILLRLGLDDEALGAETRSALHRVLAGSSNDRTYADLLEKSYIKPHVRPNRERLRYAWGSDLVEEIAAANPMLSATEWLTVTPGRPFPIVGASMIYLHDAYDFPRLIPVEYTPMYTGVRQQYGSRLGGIYVWPFAYGSEAADIVAGDKVRVRMAPGQRPFALADVVASSGAAPLLSFFIGQATIRGVTLSFPQLRRATDYFPAFNHFTLREGRVQAPDGRLLHGDGGFTDNLGLMPLLARQVKNILVFVNDQRDADESLSIESLFLALERRDHAADRSMNVVFERPRRQELLAGLAAAGRTGAAVYCDTGWKVKKNELYNIRAYDGLNICWVYNQPTPKWRERLPDETQVLMQGKDFNDFPWFATKNAKLNTSQVNLLASLSAWNITNPASKQRIQEALGDALSPE